MGSKLRIKSALGLLTVSLLITLVTKTAAATPDVEYKSFAVFVASYNSHTGEARGGVAGTAFFTSPTQGLTAYHVLQASSFLPQAGFEISQVWLVHEGEPAIELFTSDVHFDANKDLTWIHLGAGKKISAQLVFPIAQEAQPQVVQNVHTEGFLANSTGPMLARKGRRLAITSIPQLSRLHAEGFLIQKSKVELRSSDVNLKTTACLELSYQPVVGLSGGPVISNGQVIAMNSFADPRTRTETWAVDFAHP
jgi:hypothetical protein